MSDFWFEFLKFFFVTMFFGSILYAYCVAVWLWPAFIPHLVVLT